VAILVDLEVRGRPGSQPIRASGDIGDLIARGDEFFFEKFGLLALVAERCPGSDQLRPLRSECKFQRSSF
jgi:hypothetical protein